LSEDVRKEAAAKNAEHATQVPVQELVAEALRIVYDPFVAQIQASLRQTITRRKLRASQTIQAYVLMTIARCEFVFAQLADQAIAIQGSMRGLWARRELRKLKAAADDAAAEKAAADKAAADKAAADKAAAEQAAAEQAAAEKAAAEQAAAEQAAAEKAAAEQAAAEKAAAADQQAVVLAPPAVDGEGEPESLNPEQVAAALEFIQPPDLLVFGVPK
jgi:myosin heavy subunit